MTARPGPAPARPAGATVAAGTADRSRRWRLVWRWLGVLFAVAVAVAVVRALRGQDWSVVAVLLARRDGGQVGLLLAGALPAAAVGPLVGMLAWRAILRELGPPVATLRLLRVYLVGFLAKYVPGKLPGLVAAVKVAAANGVSVPRMLVSGTVTTVLVHLTGLTVGLLAGVRVLGDRVVWLALAALPVLVALCWPGLLGRLVALALRLTRRPGPAPAVSGRAVRAAIGWQTLSWLVSGVHLWLLAVAMGADAAAALPLCVGAFALATVLGVVAVVVPDGLGVREAVLVGALASVLPVPSAVAVAVASRLVTTVGEVVVGGVALAVVEVIHRRSSVVDTAVLREWSGDVPVDRS
ncbi:lysylphosphatidylglycerol synthase domain-containing protein [Micromonospora sp. NPDC023956]|uniref:lysylphosphatidylglycerol synthase domain-containing protein n=1 Tax=Micromonospora sp. NPDC023956 TaxID=3155722 RepID=UPI0033E9D1C8